MDYPNGKKMKTIINSIELLDANGTSYNSCIDTFKKGNAANVTQHTDPILIGLPKFDIPLTDDELQTELELENYEEHYMPRAIKLAVLSSIRACKNIDIPKNTAVIGVTLQGSQETGGQIWKALFNEKKFISPRWGATVTQSAICTTVSRTLGLTGPSFMINQACSAFITAMNVADLLLNSGQVEAVIVVGVDCATHPFTSYIFSSMSVYTNDVVKPFDKNRSGMALGEATVCYVLTKENRARQALANLAKMSVYNDYYNLTAPSPDGSAGKILLNDITNNNDIMLDSINCHVTATKVGDEAEILSLENLPYSCPIYGLKGSVGHTMASSAGVEIAYSIAGLNNGWVPYTSSTTDPVDSKHQIVLHNILEKEQTNFAKLSFGFGGVSAAVRIEKI